MKGRGMVSENHVGGISLSVCLFMCVYMMLVALSMCLRVGASIVGGSQVFQ